MSQDVKMTEEYKLKINSVINSYNKGKPHH